MNQSVKSLLSTIACALAFSAASFNAVQAQCQFVDQSDIGRELNLPVHQWSNPDKPVKGVVVALQALIFDGTAYDNFARHLSEHGYIVYAQDFRGYGDWLTQPDAFGADRAMHFTQSKQDLTKILQLLRQKYPQQKIFCLGESLGANVAIWEASSEPGLFDGAIAIGLANKHVRLQPKLHWAITITKGLKHPRHPIDLKPYMKPVLTEDKNVTLAMVEDKKTTTAISPTDIIKANITNGLALKELEKIPPSTSILVIAGEKDRVQRADSLPEVMDRMGSGDKSLKILKARGHLLLEHRAVDPELATIIDQWLDQQSSNQVSFKPTATAETTALTPVNR